MFLRFIRRLAAYFSKSDMTDQERRTEHDRQEAALIREEGRDRLIESMEQEMARLKPAQSGDQEEEEENVREAEK